MASGERMRVLVSQSSCKPLWKLSLCTRTLSGLLESGGSPSDSFDWQTGCALVEGNATDPFCATYGAATPQRWARYVNHSGRPAVVFDLNVVGTNASYQLEGLRRFEADGVPIELIEFGNELYAWQQNGGKWSDGAGYAKAMRPYLAALQAAFPK